MSWLEYSELADIAGCLGFVFSILIAASSCWKKRMNLCIEIDFDALSNNSFLSSRYLNSVSAFSFTNKSANPISINYISIECVNNATSVSYTHLIDEIGLAFAVRVLAVAVDRKAERTHSHIALGMPQFGVAGQSPHQNRFVQHLSKSFLYFKSASFQSGYSHSDVYKRQVQRGLRMMRSGLLMM